MSSLPLVSIITPSYNQASFLEKTICSVLDQDYSNIEYLVADGGSNDGSVEIIKKFSQRISWWVSEKDSGQAEAINKGLKRARGDVIAWINSDDYYIPGAVSEAVQALIDHPEAGFVFGNVRVVDRHGKILNHITYGDWGFRELMSFYIIGQPAVFMRRNVLEKVGLLDSSYHYLLDHQLWLRLALTSGMKYIPRLWATAHYHEGCKNLAQAAEFGKEALRIVQWMEETPAFDAYFHPNQRMIRAGAERLNGFYLLEAKEYSAAFRAYWKSFLLRPATVKQEWYRMVYAFFAPLGLDGLKERFIENRRKRLN
ncbi:MAG: putative glycosyltransferase [Chloroflexi bacterium]|nr:MAG: putative glycosyltransferase [Chloroflexota bacterium]MBA4375105.1 glycosyltransferase [Anaerolinea sp.]